MGFFSSKKMDIKKQAPYKGKIAKKKGTKKKVPKKKNPSRPSASTVLNNVHADLKGHFFKNFERLGPDELMFTGYDGTKKRNVRIRVQQLTNDYEVTISGGTFFNEKLIYKGRVTNADQVRSVVTPTVLKHFKAFKTKAKKNACSKNPLGPVINQTKSFLQSKGFKNVMQKGNVVRFSAFASDQTPRTIDAKIKEYDDGYFVSVSISASDFKGMKQWAGVVPKAASVPSKIYSSIKSDYKVKPPRRIKKNPVGKVKAPTKKQMDNAAQIFSLGRDRMAEIHPKMMKTYLTLDPNAHDGGRHFAYAKKDGANVQIAISPELLNKPNKVIMGILYHELGHALLLHGCEKYGKARSYDAKERRTDKVAEKFFGKIYYNDYMVQEAGRGAKGIRPRPKGLR